MGAEFGGGLVQIETKNVPSSFLSFGRAALMMIIQIVEDMLSKRNNEQ